MAYLDDNPPARRQFKDPRTAKPTGLIVIHTAESVMDTVGPDTGAENVAAFIRKRTDPGSYHRLADSNSVVSLVRLGCEAYGDGTGSNPYAIHIAFACRTTDWSKMSDDRRDAFLAQGVKAVVEAAKWLKSTHGIDFKVRRVTKAESAAGKSGFISHGERDPGRRTDPGAQFPWTRFLALVDEALDPKAPKADKDQKLRRAILKAEDAIKAAATEADKVGRKLLAGRLRTRASAFRKRRISLRPKKK